MDDRTLGKFIAVFDRINIRTGTWFLDQKSLLEYVINNRVMDRPQIGMIDYNEADFESRCKAFRMNFEVTEKCKLWTQYKVKMDSLPIEVKLYKQFKKSLVCAPDEVIKHQNRRTMNMYRQGTWKFQIAYNKHYAPPIPYKFGTVMDIQAPKWLEKVERIHKYNPDSDRWIVGKRAENAIELMTLLRECADIAGINEYFFVGFGTLLGIAREGDFIANDMDMDHCVQSEFINRDQEEVFLSEIAKQRTINGTVYRKGLYEGRKRLPLRRRDTKRFLWTSCGHKKIKSQNGVKSCIWNWFKHSGYDWHSKGRMWVSFKKFNRMLINKTEDAVAKGIPTGLLNKFMEIDFKGIKVNIPYRTGSVLDEWYPGWARPKKEKSSKRHTMVIESWKNKNTWKMV